MTERSDSWFQRQRQGFILGQLRAFGQIRRADIVRRFEITEAVASADIAHFLNEHPDLIDYDRQAKCYVLCHERLPGSEFKIVETPDAA